MASKALYIGLMSGTSMDSVDASLVGFSHTLDIIGSHTIPFSQALRKKIQSLCLPGNNEIEKLAMLDVEIGEMFAQCVLELLKKTNTATTTVCAIGSHGQTIRHRPDLIPPFTLQIGDPNTIAYRTGITTITDFRRKDLVAGGEGAPLVPAFHHAAFYTNKAPRVIVNIGGIANITILSDKGIISGFDTGPGNILMDGWIHRHIGKNFDKDGLWAAKGQLNEKLLNTLLDDPYFHRKAPKSTGREYFNLIWLEKYLTTEYTAEDIQTTLLELTAHSIHREISNNAPANSEVLICGGGAKNLLLKSRLSQLLANKPLMTTAQLGIPVDQVETSAFAWLAMRTMNKRTGNICTVTGAQKECILGGIYHP